MNHTPCAGRPKDLVEVRTFMDDKTCRAKLIDLQADLAELHAELNVLPQAVRSRLNGTPPTPLSAQASTQGTAARLIADALSLQDSVDHLRLSIKYMAFDLEATRRENRQLRDLLFSLAIDGESDEEAEEV